MADLFDYQDVPEGVRAENSFEGVVERIVFANPDTGYTVVRLERPDGILVTVVGNMIAIIPGETIRVTGSWKVNKKFGRQFEVETYHSVIPATLPGIEKYLGSGLVRGIGPVMAGRMVREFGADTLRIIDESPTKLLGVEGIGRKRLEMIREAWQEQREVRNIMIFLQENGITPAYAAKVYKTYGEESIEVVRSNPYRLAEDIFGIGFKIADKTAANVGIEKTAPVRVEAGVLYTLRQLTEDGHVYCPCGELVNKAAQILGVPRDLITEAVVRLGETGGVVIEEDDVYDRRLYEAEMDVAAYLHEFVRSESKPLTIKIEKAIEWAEQRARVELSDEQHDAIRKTAESKLVVVTGGPGTGKTTLVKSIIDIYSKKELDVLLAAPTGRAAKRLAESTGREAKTIHRMLEYNGRTRRFLRDSSNPLDTDMLIVDETSMIDTALMRNLLRAVPRDARLILVGDVDQLPSVGPGSVLRDIMDSGVPAVQWLTQIFRQEAESEIVLNAHRINRGEMPRAAEGTAAEYADFFFVKRDDPGEVLATVLELVAERIPRRFSYDPIGDIQVISPMHKGEAGVSRLNDELQKLLNPHGETTYHGGKALRVGDKVMQTRNNYDLEVFNGDIGFVQRVDTIRRAVTVEYDGRDVVYDFDKANEFITAYAISVHKSQGSEYPVVVMPILTQHFVLLKRNLLYTAVTRARELFVLVGSPKAVSIAVSNDEVARRYTKLAQRLREAFSD